MSRSHTWLIAAAVLQSGLIATTWWPKDTEHTQSTPLIPWTAGDIDGLAVSSADQHIQLLRRGGTWVMPTHHDYPADADRVDEVLARLTSLEVRAPMATRPANHGTLNVSKESHARTVTLSSGDQELRVVLGAASGSAVHVRRSDEDEVYAVSGWTPYAIGDQPNRYWNSQFLSLDTASLDSLTVTNPVGRFTLKKTPDGWTVAGEDIALDQAAVTSHLHKLANLRLSEIVGTQPTADLAEDTRVEWTGQQGNTSLAGALLLGATSQHKTMAQRAGERFVVRVPSSSVTHWQTLTADMLRPQMP